MPGFQEFDRVEGNYLGRGKWHSGIIVKVHGDAGAVGRYPLGNSQSLLYATLRADCRQVGCPLLLLEMLPLLLHF